MISIVIFLLGVVLILMPGINRVYLLGRFQWYRRFKCGHWARLTGKAECGKTMWLPQPSCRHPSLERSHEMMLKAGVLEYEIWD